MCAGDKGKQTNQQAEDGICRGADAGGSVELCNMWSLICNVSEYVEELWRCIGDALEKHGVRYAGSYSDTPLALWHHCLGHISEDTIQMMVKKGVVTGMEVKGEGSGNCSACQKGKQTHNVIPCVTEERSSKVLGRVFSDLCGPMETPTLEGYQYFITFTDDFSHYSHIGFCKSKDKALAVFKAWKA